MQGIAEQHAPERQILTRVCVVMLVRNDLAAFATSAPPVATLHHCCWLVSHRCMGWQTMVEVLSSKLHQSCMVASQVTSKTESRVEVTGSTEKVVRSAFAGPDVIGRARSVCRASAYHQCSKYHRKWCERAMVSKQAEGPSDPFIPLVRVPMRARTTIDSLLT